MLKKNTASKQRNNKVHWDNNPYSILGDKEEENPELMDVNDSVTRQHKEGPRMVQVENE